MSFAPGWLRLREPHDSAARDPAIEARLAAWARGRPGPLEVVDLGSGTGANLRHLAPRLPGAQRWRLVERDPALIGAARASLPNDPPWRIVRGDLAGGDLDALLGEAVDLVTASALIDLAGRPWLERLADAALAREAALLVALTVDGRIVLDPPHPGDGAVLGAVARHQRETDKGLGGPALGPDAAPFLAGLLRGRGGEVALGAADWALGPGDAAIRRELLAGWAAAAAEADPAAAGAIEAWLGARLAEAGEGRGRCRVGHLDLLFLPPGAGAGRGGA